MPAIIWTNPEVRLGKPKSLARRIVDGRELVRVDGADVWTVFKSFKRKQ